MMSLVYCKEYAQLFLAIICIIGVVLALGNIIYIIIYDIIRG